MTKHEKIAWISERKKAPDEQLMSTTQPGYEEYIMQIETLRDVLQWTGDYHRYLAECTRHCANQQLNQRAQLLLNYLSEHEKTLSTVLDAYEATADPHALNTWCYEFFEKAPVKPHYHCDKPFAEMDTQEIIEAIENQHQQLIALYQYLVGRADIPSAIELLEQLTALEEHEAMRMAHEANRLEDF
ncbi:ATPase [Teredinibacter haidensis]|uniref:ATPase n=1 Tax=Teredinibacter haidensis TaxID=2731755 RepID=UPI000AB3450C|nr:ATPase [Teredinibacter haidensis]